MFNNNISFENTANAFVAKSDRQLRKANFLFSVVNNPILSSISTGATKLAFNIGLPIKSIIKKTVFEQFCGGETIAECEATIQELARYNIGAILDYSVEGGDDEKSFDHTKNEILKTIGKAKDFGSIPFSVFKLTGLASTPLLVKINADKPLTLEETEAFGRVKDRVEEICQKAYDLEVRVMIDAEESWIQNPIDQLAYDMMEKFNSGKTIVYNTFQMYRTNMPGNLKKAFHRAAMHNYYLGVKLVRGAYMEKERERAEEYGYKDPIQPNKTATDEAFDKALSYCMDNKQRISLISGSHNEYSNHYLTLLMDKHSLNKNDERVWFAQLYGMSDNISYNLSKQGYNVAKYVPFGPVKSVLPYLFRRAEENTSVMGQSSRELSLIRKEIDRRKSLE